jgi:hypothetical protein
MRKVTVAVALASALFSAHRMVAAEEPSAQALLDAGKAALAEKRYAAACAALRQSFRVEARAETLFELARCEDRSGRLTSAAFAYEDYLALYDRLSEPERRAEQKLGRERQAIERKEAIRKRVPVVTFKLRGEVEGVRVTRRLAGGEEVDVALGLPLPIDPGEHFVATSAPDRARWEKRFFVAEAEQRVIELEIAPPDKASGLRFSRPIAPVPNLLPSLDPGPSAQRVSAFAVGGVGVATLIVGAVSGAVAWGQKGAIADNCKDQLCNLDGQRAADRAKLFGVVSTVSFVVGGLALAGGVLLYVTEPGRPKLGAVPGRIGIGFSAAPSGASAVTSWTF